MLDAGENPKTVQEFVGHADPGFMLRQYAHVLERSKKRASEKASGAGLFAERSRSGTKRRGD